jgi:ATP-dependent DNA ligase
MEAEVADDLPAPRGWGYEPKWDGFRVVIWSRSGAYRAAGAERAARAGNAATPTAMAGADGAVDTAGAEGAARADGRAGTEAVVRADGAAGAESVVRADDGPDPTGPRLDSRNGRPLLRYFPELRPALEQLPPGTVADGEVVVIMDGKLDFDALQNRIHPADSRVRRLAVETPAYLALFDLLAVAGHDLRRRPLRERRQLLEELAAIVGAGPRAPGLAAGSPAVAGPAAPGSRTPPPTATTAAPGHADGAATGSPWLLSPQTQDVEVARYWFVEFEPAGFDGIVAKGLDRPYGEGRREMIKVKHRRTVDCVIGGYRLHKDQTRVGSILLGLYDRRGELHFIGHCSSFGERQARDLLEVLRPLRAAGAVTGKNAFVAEVAAAGAPETGFGEHARRPGAVSRWSGDKDLEYEPVRPVVVVEISYDQLTGDRFRHGTRFERWRPDKDPRDCTMDQLERPVGPGVIEMLRSAMGGAGRSVGPRDR